MFLVWVPRLLEALSNLPKVEWLLQFIEHTDRSICSRANIYTSAQHLQDICCQSVHCLPPAPLWPFKEAVWQALLAILRDSARFFISEDIRDGVCGGIPPRQWWSAMTSSMVTPFGWHASPHTRSFPVCFQDTCLQG